MARFFRDKALIEYFMSHSVPVNRALNLINQGYEPQEAVRMLQGKIPCTENKILDNEENSSARLNLDLSSIRVNSKQGSEIKSEYSGSLVALYREYSGLKLGIFFVTYVEAFVSIFDTLFVMLIGIGTVESLSPKHCVAFPITELLVEATDFHNWLRNYDSKQVEQVDEQVPFLFGSSGFIIPGDMVAASLECSPRIINKSFFLYSSDLTIKDIGIRIPSFKRRFSEFPKGKKSLDILIRTNWFETNRIGANVIAMKRLVEDLSFNPVGLLVSKEDFSILSINELVTRLYSQKEHLSGRVDLTSSFFSSSLVDILSSVNKNYSIQSNLLELITEFTISDLGFVPITVSGERARFGTKAVTSISDLKSFSSFKSVRSVHDFITLNANCLREVLSMAKTPTGNFYSAFLN
ncbi:MAG: hypothetical protein ACFFD4_09745 [Candidatus Odinarchaeota archaeon]